MLLHYSFNFFAYTYSRILVILSHCSLRIYTCCNTCYTYYFARRLSCSVNIQIVSVKFPKLFLTLVSDPAEIPICEISLACDNLLCDGHGRPPNPVLEVDVQVRCSKTWIKYARTEVVEVSFQITLTDWCVAR